MNNGFKIFTASIIAFAIGFSLNNFAMSDMTNKIAVVDVQAVVNASSQVLALKKEQEAKGKELIKFVEKARKEVAATTDVKKKQALEDKYNKELAKKKEAMDKNYTTKLTAIDKSISEKIAAQAKDGGFDVVLAKGVVLYGGTDLTEAVKKAVK